MSTTDAPTAGKGLPEIVPQKLSEDVDVVLMLTAYGEADGPVYVMAFTETGSNGSPEAQARSALTGYKGVRHAGLVRVRVPRALLRERWKEADQ